MATTVEFARTSRFDRVVTERVLAAATVVMLVVVVAAVARGHTDWAAVPWPVWVHLATIAAALALTPVMLLRRKGTGSHRVLGYIWTAAMVLTAGESLTFKTGAAPGSHGVFTGDISPIHILSLVVLVMVPRLVLAARRHDIVPIAAGCVASSSAPS